MADHSPLVYTQYLSTKLTPRTAISILDGRYREGSRSLANKFSEAALQRARIAERDARHVIDVVTEIREGL